MGNPFKQVKAAIKDAYHSNTDANGSTSKPPTEKLTTVRPQHDTEDQHETNALAQAKFPIHGKRVSHTPPTPPPRQEGSCQPVKSSSNTADAQQTDTRKNRPNLSAAKVGLALPSHEESESRASTSGLTGNKPESAAETASIALTPVPGGTSTEPDEKDKEHGESATPTAGNSVKVTHGSKKEPHAPMTLRKPVMQSAKTADEAPAMAGAAQHVSSGEGDDQPPTDHAAAATPVIGSSAVNPKLPTVAVRNEPPASPSPVGTAEQPKGEGAILKPDLLSTTKSQTSAPAISSGTRPLNKTETFASNEQRPGDFKSSAVIIPPKSSTERPGALAAVPASPPSPPGLDASEGHGPTDAPDRKSADVSASGSGSSNEEPAMPADSTVSTPSAMQPIASTTGEPDATDPICSDTSEHEAVQDALPMGVNRDAPQENLGTSQAPSHDMIPIAVTSQVNQVKVPKSAKAGSRAGLDTRSNHDFRALEQRSSTLSNARSTLQVDETASDDQLKESNTRLSVPVSHKPTACKPELRLSANAMLDHLLRIYEGLTPGSEATNDQAATASEHDERQLTDYFIKFVQKESAAGSPETPSFRGFADFVKYIATSASALAPPKPEDLSLPLPNYYCNSSHNTYLTGNQLYSECSSDIYRTVLEHGCRCLEIDVWDGEDDSDGASSRPSVDSSSSEDTRTSGSKSKKWHGVYEAESQIASEIKRGVKSEAKGVMSSISGGLHKISAKAKKIMPDATPGDIEPSSGQGATSASTDSHSQSEGAPTAEKPVRMGPRVLHGHTLTREVPFREVCEVIRDSAFVTSDLPVIVSLEVHAGREQQQIMVDIMKEVWKDLLVDVSQEIQDQLRSGDIKMLPSPAELRRKILIKVKSSPKAVDSGVPKVTSSGTEIDARGLRLPSNASLESVGAASDGEQTDRSLPKTKLVEELSALGLYTSAYSFKGLDQPEAYLPNHVFSLSEAKLQECFQKDRKALFDHNRNFMMRTYPSQFRIRSSNPDPSLNWRLGVQFAALNWQSIDLGMMINRAMFDGTGGWVLKPEAYRSDSWRRNLKSPVTDPRKTLSLSIDVYAGQNIPLPLRNPNPKKFHPYISCQLHVERPKDSAEAGGQSGSDEDDSKGWKRKTSASVGVNPDFNGQRLQFPRCQNVIGNLAFVRFKVKDREMLRASLSSWACIRLDRLQPGYRLVHLLDAKGQETDGVILICVSKQLS